jgi:hypothetical protein
MVYDFIYEVIDKDDEEVLDNLTDNPEGWVADNYGCLKNSDEPVADYIWEEGYNNIDWESISDLFKDHLREYKERKAEEEEENTTDEENEDEE